MTARLVMVAIVVLAVLAVLAGAGDARATTTYITESSITDDGQKLGLVFNEGSGLSGQAIFYLLDDGPGNLGSRMLNILLTNTSTAIPADPHFDNPSDQVLTSLHFDLGAPGLNPDDPRIISGDAHIAAGSWGVGNGYSLQGDDLSKLWGFGNFQYEAPYDFLPPNFLTTIAAHGTPFTPGGKLKGPDYGAISSLDLLGAFSTGLPTITDTVVFTVYLDKPIISLAEILAAGHSVPRIEFGSDYEFGVADDPPGVVPEPATVAGLALGIGALATYIRRRRELRRAAAQP
ncbi:MAG: PEP-CTERM sorting domain-containing protein [Planctomycetes bacterium]|nr:PEP-CTERM sorting domain-containing protein [Planctomycetota bacterium]